MTTKILRIKLEEKIELEARTEQEARSMTFSKFQSGHFYMDGQD